MRRGRILCVALLATVVAGSGCTDLLPGGAGSRAGDAGWQDQVARICDSYRHALERVPVNDGTRAGMTVAVQVRRDVFDSASAFSLISFPAAVEPTLARVTGLVWSAASSVDAATRQLAAGHLRAADAALRTSDARIREIAGLWSQVGAPCRAAAVRNERVGLSAALDSPVSFFADEKGVVLMRRAALPGEHPAVGR